MRIAGRHGGGILACCVALLVALALPAFAVARPGALDRGFNRSGKVVTVLPDPGRIRSYPNYAVPFEFAPGRVAMATAPGGKLVVATSQAIVRYLANGRRDRSFGGGGAVPIEGLDGFRFQLADVAVDSQGRTLIAGTTKATNGIGLEGQPVAGPIPSIGTVRRYSADGQPDTSFGGGGIVRSFFGAPPATFEGEAYSEPTVSLLGLAVDGEDRPVLSGSSVDEVGRCGSSDARYQRSQAFVARMAVGGGPDPGFASGSSAAIRGLAWLDLPTPRGDGAFAVGGSADPCHERPNEPSVVAAFGSNGLNPIFGGDGLWSRPFMRVSDLAVAPGGRVVLLARTIELKRGKWVESAGRAIRLNRNGSLDRRFGKRGEAAVGLPRRASLAALAVDRGGRVLLAGTMRRKTRAKRGRKPRTQLQFLLVRTTAAGRPDRRFGRRGRVATGFGGRSNVRAAEILVDRANRIMIGGKFSGPKSGNAFAIARYRGGR